MEKEGRKTHKKGKESQMNKGGRRQKKVQRIMEKLNRRRIDRRKEIKRKKNTNNVNKRRKRTKETTREARPCTYLAEDQNMIHTRPLAHETNVDNMNRIFLRVCAPILVSNGIGT